MPLEIKELVIKVSVDQTSQTGGEGSSASTSQADAGRRQDPERIIRQVVEQITQNIKDKKER